MKIVKTDVPNTYKNDYVKIIQEFLDSGAEAVEVIELNKSPYAARSCFYNRIKSMGVDSIVRALVKKGKLYLIRKNGEDQ